MSHRLLSLLVVFVFATGAHAEGPVSVTAEAGVKQPQAAVDAKGRIFVAFGKGNEIRCAVSEDLGKTFREGRVGSIGALSLGMRRGPRVAVTEDAIVITAIGGDEGKGRDGDVLAWRSTDWGSTWSGPIRVNAVVGSAREGLHAMAAGPNGQVFCTWLDLRNKTTEIFGARSSDGGATWEPDVLVYHSPDKSVCECCHPSAAYGTDGTLYVMWRNLMKGNRDMYLAKSDDGGKTFSSASKLGQGSWQLNACPMDGGSVSVGANGGVTTVWMRAGSTFLASPGQKEQKLGAGVQGWTAIGPDGPYAVWLESRPGKLVMLAPGSSTPKTLSDKAFDPMIASAPGGKGPVVAAWEGTPEAPGIHAMVIAPASKPAR